MLLLLVPKLEVVALLVGAAFLCWPLYTMVQNNAPRPYDPRKLPEELME